MFEFLNQLEQVYRDAGGAGGGGEKTYTQEQVDDMIVKRLRGYVKLSELGYKTEDELTEALKTVAKVADLEKTNGELEIKVKEMDSMIKIDELGFKDKDALTQAIEAGKNAKTLQETLDVVTKERDSSSQKLTLVKKNINEDSYDDVIALAGRYINDKIDFDKAIDTVLEKYPSFAKEQGKPGFGKNFGGKGGQDTTEAEIRKLAGLDK